VPYKYDPTRSKYTKEIMEPLVKESKSYYEIIRKLDLKPTGSANERIRIIVQTLNLDTSHFLGLAHSRGSIRPKVPFEKILVYDRHSGRKEESARLRRALVESGIPERCEICGLGPEWNGQPLRLQVDHRNGDCIDNRPGNPRFLCPNCHAQTPTFGKQFKPEIGGWRDRGRKSTKRQVWRDGKRVYI
jgi:hypothetical protein